MSEDTPSAGTPSPDPIHEATIPPENPAPEQEAVEQSEKKLNQAGGGNY